jgi:hypothetical protein
MRFQIPLVVVVGLLLGLVALERWGEAAAGSAPTGLTAPDTIPPERVLWEGVAIPLEEVQRRAAAEEVQQLQARRREAQLREAQLREAQEREASKGAEEREAKRTKKDPVREASKRGHMVAEGTYTAMGRPRAGPPDPRLLPTATIGWPEVQRLPDPYPLQQMPLPTQAQLQAADFYLIRLSCSLRPAPRSRVGWARFHVYLPHDTLGRQPVAYDISPVEITREVKRHLKFTLDPTLKFQSVEAKGAGLEFGLEYPELQPIIAGAGVGEANPTWDYQTATGMAGIQGAKVMYLLVKAPKGMPEGTAQLALTAQVYVESLASWIPIVWGPAELGARLDVRLWPGPSAP